MKLTDLVSSIEPKTHTKSGEIAIVVAILALSYFIGCEHGMSLHPEVAGISSTTVEKKSDTHIEATIDSSHTEKNTRLVAADVAPGTLPEAKGKILPNESAPIGCAPFSLPLTFVPGDDFASYYSLSIDEMVPSTQDVRGIHIGHSRLLIPVTDSSKFYLHKDKSKDSSSSSITRDSTVTTHPTRFYSIEAMLSTPVFRSGVLQWAPFETMAAIRANVYLGEVLAIGLRPELPVLSPFSIAKWQVNLDVAFTLKTAYH